VRTTAALPLGLIVDWGGVLTTPINDSFAILIGREQLDPGAFKASMRRMHDEPGSPLHQVEVGAMNRYEFEAALAPSLVRLDGRAVSPDGLLERMFGHTVRNEPVRSIVTAARARGWRTAVLSNAWGMEYDEGDLGSLVEVLLLSDRIGLRKPDPPAYRFAADPLDLEPGACVFVDDLRRNEQAGSDVGMDGFQYRPGTEGDLAALLLDREARLDRDSQLDHGLSAG